MKLAALSIAIAAVAFAQTPAAPKKAAPAVKKAATPAAKPAAAKPAAAAKADPNDPVVIEVGNERITQSQFEKLLEALPEQYKNAARGPRKREFADQVASMKALAQEARRRKLDQAPEFKTQVEFQYENLLANALFADLNQNGGVPDAELRKYYDEQKSQYEQAKARHILIRFKSSPVPARSGLKELTEEEALEKTNELRKQILGGASFEELAKKESDDTVSGQQGGDLGRFGHGQMVAAFDEVAFKAPLNEVTEPVKTQFGYHLILVEERGTKPFEDARLEIERVLRPQRARKAVEDIKTSAGSKLSDDYFGPATPPPAPPAAK